MGIQEPQVSLSIETTMPQYPGTFPTSATNGLLCDWHSGVLPEED